jgi:alkylglycerol monooxygenase
MEAYATALTFAIPGFVILMIIEEWYARKVGVTVNRDMDVISSLSSGMTNVMKSVLGLSIAIITYEWMVDRISIFTIESTWLVYVLCFVGLDFVGYWSHRFDHVINLFWNRHIIHHSSEEFNLGCALRQSISAIVSIYFFLYIPMALIGIPAQVVAFMAPLHLFAQFWYHTRLIDKMGILEHVIVTPSHHRVHHAINGPYLDKNFAQIFIVWDKWFGTFQEELADEPPVYGVKRQPKSWNPFIINYQHFWLLIKDAFRAKSLWDKIRIWFMPTGWRPSDVAALHPVPYIDDPYSQVKYDTAPGLFLKWWSWIQLALSNLFLYYILIRIADFAFKDILMYCIWVALSIFAYTSLMDKAKWAIPSEWIKFTLGLLLFWSQGNWFQINEWIPFGDALVLGYMIISLLMSHIIWQKELKNSRFTQIA